MRRIIFIIMMLNHTVGFTQRYDFNWILGYLGGQGDSRFGTSQVDFNFGNPLVKYIDEGRMFMVETNASISDNNGRLLYYSNGYDIEDSNYKKVIGATNLGIRYWDGLVVPQGVLMLPFPASNDSVNVFYINLLKNASDFKIVELKYLLINSKNNNVVGRGVVLKDSLNEGFLTACKHANGRDWWIVANKWESNIIYKILITPQGIVRIDTQQISIPIKDGLGQSIFSPNGNYFANYECISDIDGANIYLFHFDRCSGVFSFLNSENIAKMGFGGISFSPNSKLLYIGTGYNLYQLDISNEVDFRKLMQIDTINEFILPRKSGYYIQQPGPDGRIYISPSSTHYIQHVINKPNELFEACKPTFNSFQLKSIAIGIPNHPNFRLGPIDGSSCDTLGIDNIPWAWWRHDQDTTDHLRFEFTDLSAYEVTEWHWDFGDGIITEEQSPIHSFQKNGIYEACLIAKNKNGADTLCKTLNVGTVSLNDVHESIEFEIFPNPCTEYFIVNVLNYIPERMNLTLYNLEGQEIFSKRLFEGSNGVDVESIPKGVYLIKVLEKGKVVMNEKVIKM